MRTLYCSSLANCREIHLDAMLVERRNFAPPPPPAHPHWLQPCHTPGWFAVLQGLFESWESCHWRMGCA